MSTGSGFSERILGEVIYRGVPPKQLYVQIINTLQKKSSLLCSPASHFLFLKSLLGTRLEEFCNVCDNLYLGF